MTGNDRRVRTRLFLTVWLVYGLHFATNIVREHYPAFSLAERGTLRVDPYLGLHPDLFALEGRGAFINNNPGASVFGAIPYVVLRPVVDRIVERAGSSAVGNPDAGEYNDPRPLRREFYRSVRERGLDLRFGLAAGIIQAFGVAPLGALAVVVLWGVLRREGAPRRQALFLALVFALGTPIFFRSATLNHNLLVAHFSLFAFALLQRREGAELTAGRLFGAGLLAGLAVFCDFSGIVPLIALGLYALAGLRAGGASPVRWAWMVAGGSLPIAALLGYQAWAFGSPWWPAQSYMPSTELSVHGWFGFDVPSAELLLRNLFDPRYGLFAFAPILLLASAAGRVEPGWRESRPPRRQSALIWALFLGSLLFTSANQFALLQWNTGFRMLAVVVPFLFIPAARVLAALPRTWSVALGCLAIFHSWCIAMIREDALRSVSEVVAGGLRLPWLTSLWRAGSGYLAWLETTGPRAWPLFVLLGLALYFGWRPAGARRA